jgi:hypothetical protein
MLHLKYSIQHERLPNLALSVLAVSGDSMISHDVFMIAWFSKSGVFLRPPCLGLHRRCSHYGPFDKTTEAQRAISTPPIDRRYVYDTCITTQRTDTQAHQVLYIMGMR